MKRSIIMITLLAVLLGACKSEKKINSYEDIYSERPTVIYLAPVNDKAERRVEKYPADIAYNNEINTAKAYLYQTLSAPLIKNGYYVIGPVASRQIDESLNMTSKELRNGDLSAIRNTYGIDAILMVTLHKWKDENGKKTAFLEYHMRSTKTNVDLLHTWVMAVKQVSTNLKGDPITLSNDTRFAKRFDMDNGTAQRSFLVEKVNDYILRDLPTSSLRRQFEKDQYKNANPTYIKYVWMDGGADVQNCSAEEYESNAFL
ncbi:MAG: hypothetical protein IJK07_09460 [Bacteroidales bacterium]|nr:hypothetical protein [Bacteroidales bacterium]